MAVAYGQMIGQFAGMDDCMTGRKLAYAGGGGKGRRQIILAN